MPGIKRRQFLSTIGSAVLSLKADAAPAAAEGEWRNRQTGISYRRLGRTGYLVSEVVMGGNTITTSNHDHVLAALDRGLNYLDTAPAYGRTESEKGLALVIRSRPRDRFFLTSKVSLFDLNRAQLFRDIFGSLSEPEQKRLNTKVRDEIARTGADKPDYIVNYFQGQRDELEAAVLANLMEQQYGRRIDRAKNYRQLVIRSVEESLGRLGTDHLDLLMCPHGASTGYELTNFPEVFDAFEALRKAGKVRHLGVSAHNDPAGILEAAAATGVYSAAMIAFNIVNRQFVEPAIRKAQSRDVGVIAMKVARPVHTGRTPAAPPERVRMIDQAIPGRLKAPQKAYVWALRNPGVTAVISEMTSLAHVEDNLPLAAPKA